MKSWTYLHLFSSHTFPSNSWEGHGRFFSTFCSVWDVIVLLNLSRLIESALSFRSVDQRLRGREASDGVRSPCPPVSAVPSCVPSPTALGLWRDRRSAAVCPPALWSGCETAGSHYSGSAVNLTNECECDLRPGWTCRFRVVALCTDTGVVWSSPHAPPPAAPAPEENRQIRAVLQLKWCIRLPCLTLWCSVHTCWCILSCLYDAIKGF